MGMRSDNALPTGRKKAPARSPLNSDNNEGDDDNISFVCQRCLQPLKINPSFYSMNEHTLAELSLPMSPAPEINLESDSGSLDKLVPPFHLPNLAESNATLTGSRPNMVGTITTNSHGFTLVGESGQQDVFISQKLAMSAELFDIISSNSDVDHPLCEECTDTLLDTMDQVNSIFLNTFVGCALLATFTHMFSCNRFHFIKYMASKGWNPTTSRL